jgi:hypothetical protein
MSMSDTRPVTLALALVLTGSLATPDRVTRAAAPGAAAPAQFPGRFGGPAPRQLLGQFDTNGDKRLDSSERRAAKEYIEAQGVGRRGRGGRGMNAGPVEAGPPVARTSVRSYPTSMPFYDLSTLRTLFFDFEDSDWEAQLMAFKDTDIELPSTLTIDGRTLRDVDVQFRGASSFMMVPEGRKHSLNVTIDAVHKKQEIGGYNSLNLLNSHEDPTHLRAVLFLQAARDYIPAARANFVRVVINDESWGIYGSVQQVDKAFLQEWFKTREGTRWKVPGSPGGRGGLEYFGEDVAQYKRVYEIKGEDDPQAWRALIQLTRVLNQTPPDELEAALAPILDVDGALRFLALDNTLVNNDGYWVRASDYNLYRDPAGRFHVIPHDTNETFAAGRGRGPGAGGRRGAFAPPGPVGFARPSGPGARGPMGGGGATLDPLVGLDDTSKPLRSRLLAAPALRAKYLAYTREIATKWLDWAVLGPLVTRYQALIAADVKSDTRKLDTFEAFESGVEELRNFAETRRAMILAYGPQ